MVTNDKSNINFEELVSGLIKDINIISESVAGFKEPQTMDDIDVSVFKMDSLKGLLNSAAVRMKAQAEETAAGNEAQVDEVTETITRDLNNRRVKIQSDLEEFQNSVNTASDKMTAAEKIEADILLKNVTNRAVTLNRSVEELKVQKELAVLIVNPINTLRGSLKNTII